MTARGTPHHVTDIGAMSVHKAAVAMLEAGDEPGSAGLRLTSSDAALPSKDQRLQAINAGTAAQRGV